MSDSARQTVKPEVTLFSGIGHTGDSCVLPMDGSTYSLRATGLNKIASVRVDWPDHGMAKPVVRLYTEVPTQQEDFAVGQGSAFKDFIADTADTGKWAGAKCVKGYADDGRATARTSFSGHRGERTVLDTLDDPNPMPNLSRPSTGRGLLG
ncbi:hypothetical protein [Streptomyces sp. A0592]|uniref:hypothetical protein n=1 Tax=Streptomyces sp. A0592 TaxID=2563099 RepID=UPI00109E54F3|nr:hypothetical protein [Streptomyces sp. A0592]THA86198.1 hypothetical protein E6U81_04165 [Streptomyces sp. A0592]